MWFSLAGIVVLLVAILQQSAGKGTMHDRSALYRELGVGYQKYLEPNGPDEGPVVVTDFLFVRRVMALENGILTLDVWVEKKWNDPRLKWDRKKYNVDRLFLPSGEIWQPDIALVDSAKQYTGFPSKDIRVIVTSDGNVTFVPREIVKPFCQFGKNQEKNKEVVCTLRYMSLTHDTRSLDIRIDKMAEVYLNTNPKWKIEKIAHERKVYSYKGSPGLKYVGVDYNVHLKEI